MTRTKIDVESKAKSVPISLKPKHIEMLDALEKAKKMQRSRLVQKLIVKAYREFKRKTAFDDDYSDFVDKSTIVIEKSIKGDEDNGASN
jgi:hypothetical protein